MRDALPSLGDVTMVSIDVDPNENADVLRRFADQHGFRWRFAVAPRDMLRDLAEAFGTEFLTPPSEPMFVVDPDGVPHLVPYGHRDAARLREIVQRYRGR